jgi:hypothetical protein
VSVEPRLGNSTATTTWLPVSEMMIGLASQPHELDLLDAWAFEQEDIPETRQAAIRRLIALVCGKGKSECAGKENRNEYVPEDEARAKVYPFWPVRRLRYALGHKGYMRSAYRSICA